MPRRRRFSSGLSDAIQKQADALQSLWNIYANKSASFIVLQGASMLQSFQDTVLSAGQVRENITTGTLSCSLSYVNSQGQLVQAIPAADPSVQAQVISRIEGLGILAQGVLQILVRGRGQRSRCCGRRGAGAGQGSRQSRLDVHDAMAVDRHHGGGGRLRHLRGVAERPVVICVLGGEIDLLTTDTKGRENTIVCPSGYGLLFDPDGKSLGNCRRVCGSNRRYAESALENFRSLPRIGSVTTTKLELLALTSLDGRWDSHGRVKEIIYFRPGKYADDWHHEFEKPVALFKQGRWWKLKLGDCKIDWRGIVTP